MEWSDFSPRRTNRGSTPAPEEVVGREAFVAQLWQTLERQSILLTAQRRLGKSSVLIVMEAHPAEGSLVFKRDLENIRTPGEFVESVLEDINASLSTQKRAGEWFNALRNAIGGVEISGVMKLPPAQAQHWKTHLEKIIDDLMSNEERQVVFLWDEIPLMLDNISKQSGEQAAMEVLDTLRASATAYTTAYGLYWLRRLAPRSRRASARRAWQCSHERYAFQGSAGAGPR